MNATKRPAAERAAERFRTDTADHVMEVALDQGLYRHLRFRKPGTGFNWFDIITTHGAAQTHSKPHWSRVKWAEQLLLHAYTRSSTRHSAPILTAIAYIN